MLLLTELPVSGAVLLNVARPSVKYARSPAIVASSIVSWPLVIIGEVLSRESSTSASPFSTMKALPKLSIEVMLIDTADA